jgi:hypothetical protein
MLAGKVTHMRMTAKTLTSAFDDDDACRTKKKTKDKRDAGRRAAVASVKERRRHAFRP